MNVSWFGRFAEVVGRGRIRAAPMLAAALALGTIAALSACGGGGDEEEPGPTTSPGETAAPDASTPTAAPTLAEITSLCDLVTPDDVQDVLGESVTGSNEFKDVSCGYAIGARSLNIERGSQLDFDEGVARTGDLGEAVPGIGDEAAWFGADSGGNNTLSVRQGEFYFQIRMFVVPGIDTATQFELAKELAAKAVERLP